MANAQKPSKKKLHVPYSQHNLPNATVTGVNRYREALRKCASQPIDVATLGAEVSQRAYSAALVYLRLHRLIG
jgi:hypothetical protein